MSCWLPSREAPEPRGRNPSGAGSLCSNRGGSARRSSSSTPHPASIRVAGELASALAAVCSAESGTASMAAFTARTRRRNQRTALGNVTSKPRSASAADSMLRADFAASAAASIELSRPGSRAERKSGSRLNVR